MSADAAVPAERRAPAIRLEGIDKRFGAVQANRRASLEVLEGEIHAVVGENGAGKSTLMRILAGLYQPDSGTMHVYGRDVTGWSTAEAIAAGVGMVHQHFMLIPTLTVAENVVLGREPKRGLAIDMARAVVEVKAVAQRFGFDMDVRRLVGELSVGEAQRVEILKALFRGARVLILDEPTAVLSPPEVRELWRVLEELRTNGGTIVLITHKLDEVTEVSDRITVMRQGETVARMETSGTTPEMIARAMVGRDVSLATSALSTEAVEHARSEAHNRGDDVLVATDVVVAGPRRPRAVDGITFSIGAGEIFGVAGVEGNGQTELVEAIAGLRAITSGSLTLGGSDITRLDVARRGAAGIAHIPEDRHRRGLVLDYSIADNLILGDQRRYASRLALDRARIATQAADRIAQFDIRPPDPALPARALSGGNQQKIVIAREMGDDFVLLLASQPTRGVDVGAIEFIHARLRAARDAGKAILLVSAELTEILALSDRVGVMYGGKLVAVLPRAEATEESLGPLMTGVRTDRSETA